MKNYIFMRELVAKLKILLKTGSTHYAAWQRDTADIAGGLCV